MTTLSKIVKWIQEYEIKFGRRPKMVPISAPEILEISDDSFPQVRDLACSGNQICGIDTETSYWAEMTRQKILEIGVERLSIEQRIDENRFNIEQSRNPVSGFLHRRLTAEILTDVTHLDVSFDWDRLAWLKRKVEWIGRKWPVKRKTVRIEGKVLYPYLKIQAPADTHRVRFLVQP